jgi:hypothetical protein
MNCYVEDTVLEALSLFRNLLQKRDILSVNLFNRNSLNLWRTVHPAGCLQNLLLDWIQLYESFAPQYSAVQF